MIKFAFFGTDEFAVTVLEQLKKAKGLLPALIVTTPDKPQGRKLVLTPPPVKLWAQSNHIPLGEPAAGYDVFVVASYGKIIKRSVLDLPTHGTLNIHPSLLPKYRGPTPLQSAILNGDSETGVSIMLLDEQVDHGPILASQSVALSSATNFPTLRDQLAKLGADLLAEVLPKWVAGAITAREQNHSQATFTKKIEKSDGEVKLSDDANLNYHKFLAYTPWPGIYFFDNNKRVKVTDAVLENNVFVIKKVVPEGKSEMTWEAYKLGR